jgi:hypothetical protein
MYHSVCDRSITAPALPGSLQEASSHPHYFTRFANKAGPHISITFQPEAPFFLTQHTRIFVNMKLTLATLFSPVSASVLFALSSEPGGHGTMKSWVVNRGVCHDLAPDGFDKQASWAFVEGGLANGCFLYA